MTNIGYQEADYPVSALGSIEKANSQTVRINLHEAKLGRLSIPKQLVPKIESALNRFVNLKLAAMGSFRIEELELKEGYLHFKGTLPEEVSADDSGTSSSWLRSS